MPENPDPSSPPDKSSRTVNRKLILACLAVSVGVAVWTVVRTEMRVSELRAMGFTDAATGSARDHAYMPLIGAYVGSLVFVLIALGVRRLLRRGK